MLTRLGRLVILVILVVPSGTAGCWTLRCVSASR